MSPLHVTALTPLPWEIYCCTGSIHVLKPAIRAMPLTPSGQVAAVANFLVCLLQARSEGRSDLGSSYGCLRVDGSHYMNCTQPTQRRHHL